MAFQWDFSEIYTQIPFKIQEMFEWMDEGPRQAAVQSLDWARNVQLEIKGKKK